MLKKFESISLPCTVDDSFALIRTEVTQQSHLRQVLISNGEKLCVCARCVIRDKVFSEKIIERETFWSLQWQNLLTTLKKKFFLIWFSCPYCHQAIPIFHGYSKISHTEGLEKMGTIPIFHATLAHSCTQQNCSSCSAHPECQPVGPTSGPSLFCVCLQPRSLEHSVLSITQPHLVVVLVALLHRWTIGAIIFLCKTSKQKIFLLCNRISAVASWSHSGGCLAVMQFPEQIVSRVQ